MLLLRSILFYLGLVAATLIFVPLSLILFSLPISYRFRVVAKWAVFNLWWLKLTCKLHHEVEGLENIPDGAAIIMCKHQSVWETLALQQIFPPQVWVLKRELLWIPIYGWGLAAMQPIAIDRESGIRSLHQLVNVGCQRLVQGLWVVIFPEGTRVAPGERKKYHPGGGMLAEKSGYPIIPVVHNAGKFWPKNSLKKWPGCIRMVIGPAIETTGNSANEITRKVEDWIESTAQELEKNIKNNKTTENME